MMLVFSTPNKSLSLVLSPSIMLMEISQSQKDIYYVILLTGGPWRSQIHRDRKEMVGPGAGKGEGSECFMGTEFQFGKLRKFWRWMLGMVSQQCERA